MSNIIDDRIGETQYIPEFEILLENFKKINPKNVLEIGSYMGWSLHHWIKFSQREAKVVSVDLPIRVFCGSWDPRCKQQEDAIKNEWKSWTKQNNTKLYLIQDYSQKKETVDSVRKLINKELLDFVFIDGNHMYEAVKMDFEMYLPLVRKGGIIAFHDIGYAEEGGVHKLWDDIKTNYQNIELRLHPKQEKGIGIIFK
jgi:predicted O-methyltransferase YrrM